MCRAENTVPRLQHMLDTDQNDAPLTTPQYYLTVASHSLLAFRLPPNFKAVQQIKCNSELRFCLLTVFTKTWPWVNHWYVKYHFPHSACTLYSNLMFCCIFGVELFLKDGLKTQNGTSQCCEIFQFVCNFCRINHKCVWRKGIFLN